MRPTDRCYGGGLAAAWMNSDMSKFAAIFTNWLMPEDGP